MLQVWKHVILPHSAIMLGFFRFVPPNMLLEVIKFGNQKIFFSLQFMCTPKSNQMHFLIRTKDKLPPM
jgi:hypothetical protein